MPKQLAFTLEDNGNWTITAPTNLIEALGLHAMMGDAIRMRAAQEAAKPKIEIPTLAIPSHENIRPFGR